MIAIHTNIGTDAMRSNPMLKTTVLTIPLLVMGIATAAAADTVDRIKVYDHTTTVVTQIPTTKTRCQNVEVPIY